jgi:hypothetical protein
VDAAGGVDAKNAPTAPWKTAPNAVSHQNSEHAFVDTPERLALNKSFETFDTQRELAQRQRSLSREPALTQPREVPGQRVLGSVDDPERLPAAALHGRLQQTA